MYASTTGVTELRDLFSKMIREGIITREEAVERLKTEDVIPHEVANDVLKDIGLQVQDLNLKLENSELLSLYNYNSIHGLRCVERRYT